MGSAERMALKWWHPSSPLILLKKCSVVKRIGLCCCCGSLEVASTNGLPVNIAATSSIDWWDKPSLHIFTEDNDLRNVSKIILVLEIPFKPIALSLTSMECKHLMEAAASFEKVSRTWRASSSGLPAIQSAIERCLTLKQFASKFLDM